MAKDDTETTERLSSINLKVSQEERWAFKAWCAQSRMTQGEAFRRAFELLQAQQFPEGNAEDTPG